MGVSCSFYGAWLRCNLFKENAGKIALPLHVVMIES